MKIVSLITVYIMAFELGYLVLSTFGLLSGLSYEDILTHYEWLVFYTAVFGWWMALLPAKVYYDKHIKSPKNEKSGTVSNK
jgi:purine-cytosine permease-like protein